MIFLVAYLAALLMFPRSHGRIINGDAIQYYAYLRSLVIDRDVDFSNEYEVLYSSIDDEDSQNVWLTRKTATGRPVNMMSIGPALLSMPFFLGAYGSLLLLRPFGIAIPLNGFSLPFLMSAGIAGIVYATLGAYFCYRSCRLLFDARPAFWGALVAWLATPAVYYSVVSPAYSHAPSFFATSLFCYVWLKTRSSVSPSRFAWLGILAGLAAVVRWQDAIVLVLPFCEMAWTVWKRRMALPAAILRGLIVLCGLALMLLPQLTAWRAIYGEFLVMPQGEGFMRWTSPAVIAVLFSLRHGLFTWTPVVLPAVAGLYFVIRRDWLLGWSAVFVVALAVYINASASDWWAGAAFGARRFVGYTVFFALGLSALFARAEQVLRLSALRWGAVALLAYNLLFVLQYQLFMRGFHDLAPYPSTVRQVFFDRLILPWRLLERWLGS
jgi:hypothetical protein